MAVIRINTPAAVTVDTSFTAQLLLDDPQNLGGFEFDLSFRANVLQVQSATLGPLLGSTGRVAEILGPLLDNKAGSVALGGYSYGTPGGATKGGVLGWIRFYANALGDSDLILANSLCADVHGNPLNVTVQNATVMVTPYVPEPQIPSISSLSQDSAPAGSTDLVLTLVGANFEDGAVVLWNGQALPTQWISSRQLKVEISASLLREAKIVTVQVINPTGGLSNAVQFSVYEQAKRFLFLPLIPKRAGEKGVQLKDSVYLPLASNEGE